eukprot:370161-Pelagomonas_calceolata.AAC.1
MISIASLAQAAVESGAEISINGSKQHSDLLPRLSLLDQSSCLVLFGAIECAGFRLAPCLTSGS